MQLTDPQYDDLNQQLAEVAMEKSLKTTPAPWMVNPGPNPLKPQYATIYAGEAPKHSHVCDIGQRHSENWLANATLIAAAPDLLAAVEAQHKAIDWLMARLIGFDESFMPSQSKAWPAVVMGHAAIKKATL